MECSDTTALSSYVLVNDTLLVNESSPTEENGALYQSSAGNTAETRGFKPIPLARFSVLLHFFLCSGRMPPKRKKSARQSSRAVISEQSGMSENPYV